MLLTKSWIPSDLLPPVVIVWQTIPAMDHQWMLIKGSLLKVINKLLHCFDCNHSCKLIKSRWVVSRMSYSRSENHSTALNWFSVYTCRLVTRFSIRFIHRGVHSIRFLLNIDRKPLYPVDFLNSRVWKRSGFWKWADFYCWRCSGWHRMLPLMHSNVRRGGGGGVLKQGVGGTLSTGPHGIWPTSGKHLGSSTNNELIAPWRDDRSLWTSDISFSFRSKREFAQLYTDDLIRNTKDELLRLYHEIEDESWRPLSDLLYPAGYWMLKIVYWHGGFRLFGSYEPKMIDR